MEKVNGSSNTFLKIGSLILAIALWAYVAYQDTSNISHWFNDIPITIVGADELSAAGYYVTGTNRNSIDVKLRGDRIALSHIKAGDISVLMDVSGIRMEGETAVICDVSVDSNKVEVVSSRHGTVTVSAEEIITDTYPLSIKMVGSPADGYSVFDTTLSSGGNVLSEITVRGAKSVVRSVASVSTKSVSVEGSQTGNKVAVGLTAYDAEGNSVTGVSFEPSTVDVTYTVLREKTVPLNIALTKVPVEKEIDYSPKTVKVYGSADVLSRIESISSLPLDVSEAADGDSYSAQLVLPDGARLSTNDSAVDIKVSVELLKNEGNSSDENKQ